MAGQAREAPRDYLERESHYVWGRRYLLTIKEGGAKPSVSLGHRSIELSIPKGSPVDQREAALSEWYRAELRERADTVLAKWTMRHGVSLSSFAIQRMKTKWGSSKPGRHVDGRGLCLLAKESGAATWVLRMQHKGRRRDYGLGSAMDVSLAEAREAATARDCYDALKGSWKTTGTTLGMMLANVPTVFLGQEVLKYVPLKIVRMIAAGLFLIIGLWVLAQTAG